MAVQPRSRVVGRWRQLFQVCGGSTAFPGRLEKSTITGLRSSSEGCAKNIETAHTCSAAFYPEETDGGALFCFSQVPFPEKGETFAKKHTLGKNKTGPRSGREEGSQARKKALGPGGPVSARHGCEAPTSAHKDPPPDAIF